MHSDKKHEELRTASGGIQERAGDLHRDILDTTGFDWPFRRLPTDPSPRARHSLRTESQRSFLDRRQLWVQNRPRTQKPELSVTEFVRRKLIPEHLSKKKTASQIHYRAILKHVLNPFDVDNIFHPTNHSGSKLKPNPDWPYLGDMYLSNVRPVHVQKLMTAAQERGYSSQTVLHIRNAVSMIFAHAKRCHYHVGANPALLVRMPELNRKFSYLMTPAQVKNVLDFMHYPEKEMALVVMLTGANIAEVCGLQWKYVNLTGSSIDVDGDSIPRFSIAIRRQWHRGSVTDVSRKRIRSLEIPELLLGIFLKLSTLSRCTEPNDFVFACRTGAPINPTNISVRRLKPIGEKLHIPSMSWYLFRRMYVDLTSRFGAQANHSISMILHSDFSWDDLANGSPGRF